VDGRNKSGHDDAGATFVKAIVITLAIIAFSGPAHAQALPGGFVFLRDIDPTILQDIRYAGSNNFIGRPLAGYEAGECVVKREVGLALKSIQQELALQKLSLKMLDCYRPARASRDMWLWAQNGRETPAERRFNPAFPKADLFRLGYIATHSQHSTCRARSHACRPDRRPFGRVRFRQNLCRLHRARKRPRAGRQHRHGNRL
jgi:zinc D-Ala-D-Ala dipeptidase